MEQVAEAQFGLQGRGDQSSYGSFSDGAVTGDYGDAGSAIDFGTQGGSALTVKPDAVEEESVVRFDFNNNPWFKAMQYKRGITS